MPVTEQAPIKKAESPYGNTKQVNEEIIQDYIKSGANIKSIILRYFNPIGAHESGLIGEDPKGIPNNLLPYIAKVAAGKLECLSVFGNDYPTPDGTGVRDFIHVTDLAKGHLKALKKLVPGSGVSIYNLGTGTGYSVLDVLHAYEKACGPMTMYGNKSQRSWDWVEGPWPWESEAN